MASPQAGLGGFFDEFSKLLGLWQSEVGGLNRVVHIWPYESFEDRERIGQEARKTGKWPPKTQEFIITQENKIVQPAPFSPPLPDSKLGNVYEFRTYTYQPGTMPIPDFEVSDPDQRKEALDAGAKRFPWLRGFVKA